MNALSNQEVLQLPLDDFFCYLLSSGKYRADANNGYVYNAKTNQLLGQHLNKGGYFIASFVFNRKVVRQVKVHRVIALHLFGLKACKGKQIAHLDGNKTNNIGSNLRPMDAAAHVAYDGTDKNLVHGKPKEKWKPCFNCNEKQGPISAVTPIRISGKRFGIDGDICRRCYGMLQERERRAKQGVAPGTRKGRHVFDEIT